MIFFDQPNHTKYERNDKKTLTTNLQKTKKLIFVCFFRKTWVLVESDSENSQDSDSTWVRVLRNCFFLAMLIKFPTIKFDEWKCIVNDCPSAIFVNVLQSKINELTSAHIRHECLNPCQIDSKRAIEQMKKWYWWYFWRVSWIVFSVLHYIRIKRRPYPIMWDAKYQLYFYQL